MNACMLRSSLPNLPMFIEVDMKENIVKTISGALLGRASFGLGFWSIEWGGRRRILNDRGCC